MAKNKINFSTYPQDYFTGAQVKIYIGSVWVDDIATIQYDTSNSKSPIFGFSDHQFRSVFNGQFLVRGSFTIAFKETGYLYQIIKLFREDKLLDPSDKTKPFLTQLAQGITIEKALDSLAGSSSEPDTKSFQEATNIMEDAIWGKEDAQKVYKNRIPRADELDYDQYINNKSSDNDDIDINGFDILMTFGNYKNGNDSVEHTIISINDIHITGETMIVTPAAEPIGLTLDFFARGVNEKVSNAWPNANIEVAATENDTDI